MKGPLVSDTKKRSLAYQEYSDQQMHPNALVHNKKVSSSDMVARDARPKGVEGPPQAFSRNERTELNSVQVDKPTNRKKVMTTDEMNRAADAIWASSQAQSGGIQH